MYIIGNASPLGTSKHLPWQHLCDNLQNATPVQDPSPAAGQDAGKDGVRPIVLAAAAAGRGLGR